MRSVGECGTRPGQPPVLTRMAFGFTKPEALVALAMLALGGYCPPLPGRSTPK